MVIVRTSVVAPVPPKVLLVGPAKVMPAPAVLALVLKSRLPLLVRLPPTVRTCPVTAPLTAEVNEPPESIVTLLLTVRLCGAAESNINAPPFCTVTDRADAAVSIVMAQLLVMVTLSPAVGTLPPQVAGALQSPPPPAQAALPAGGVAWLPARTGLNAPSLRA